MPGDAREPQANARRCARVARGAEGAPASPRFGRDASAPDGGGKRPETSYVGARSLMRRELRTPCSNGAPNPRRRLWPGVQDFAVAGGQPESRETCLYVAPLRSRVVGRAGLTVRSRPKARKATESASRTDEARDRGERVRPRGQQSVRARWRHVSSKRLGSGVGQAGFPGSIHGAWRAINRFGGVVSGKTRQGSRVIRWIPPFGGQ